MEPLKPAQCNAVQLDRIWTDYVHREAKTVHEWKAKWGFLSQEYNKVSNDIRRIRYRSTRNRSTSDESCNEMRPLKLPPIVSANQKVSPVPFIPVKTSQEIGWRVGHPLERFGRLARPKGSIVKQLGWPIDALS